MQGNTYLNVTDNRKWFNVTYCDVTGPGHLNVTINNGTDELEVSPWSFTVIPGPWNLSNSDFYESNDGTNGCQAHENCTATIILKDDFGNNVNEHGIFEISDMDTQFKSENET